MRTELRAYPLTIFSGANVAFSVARPVPNASGDLLAPRTLAAWCALAHDTLA